MGAAKRQRPQDLTDPMLEIAREVDALIREGTERRPKGYRPVLAWVSDTHIVVEGTPPDEPDDGDDSPHNCDVMGCGLCHVVIRLPFDERGLQPASVVEVAHG